jgi:tetratricopeptide (TPR) repeat protein
MAQQVAEDPAGSEDSSAGAGGKASAHGGDPIDAWDVLEYLGALVDKSLVLADGDELPRYRLLETTRLFALERLADAGETAALLHRHALAVQAALSFNPGSAQRLENLADWTRLTIEIDNVRAAMDWAASSDDDLLVVDLVGRAGLAFIAAGLRGEFLTRALAFEARVVAAAPSLPPNVVGRYWFRLANVGANVAHPAAAHAALQAARIYRALGQSAVVYEALIYAIGNGTLRGQAEPLRAWVEEAEALEQADWPPSLRANFQWARHRWLLMQGRTEEALQCALKQAELTRQYDAAGFVHIVLGGNVAACELALGRVQQAEARARQALESLETSGAVVLGLGHLLQTLALALVMQGRHGEAAVMIRRAQRHLAREGDDLRLLETAALHAAGQGRMEDAARALGHAEAALRRNGEVRWPAVAARCEGLRVQLSSTLDADMLERLMVQGAALSRDESFNVALRPGGEAVEGSDGLRLRGSTVASTK